MRNRPLAVGLGVGGLLAVLSMILFWLFAADGSDAPAGTAAGDPLTTITLDTSTATTGTTIVSSTSPGQSTTTTTTIADTPLHPWGDAREVGQPWGDAVEGLLTFRGNASRTWYGKGPVPDTPEIEWRYPDAPMCSQSTDLGVTSTWCGNGWTGQPVIWERPDGVTEMIFGGYDSRLHFVDADTGIDTRSPIQTGDIIKGTPTIDPDGYPIVYFGSRDNKLRAVALDRPEPVVLWDVDASGEGRWNDDWDASPLVANDYMFEGAENSIFYIFKLNRAYDELGLVTIDPVQVYRLETWTDQLMADIGPGYPAVSVENSTAMYEGRIYFANSGGRVIGLDISSIDQGDPEIVFDYWVGDDVDATIVIDADGMLYVAAEYERYLPRAQDLGQLIKLDPYAADPYVWGMYSLTEPPAKGGLWSTPALGDGVLYAVTHKGFLIAVDQETGEELWVYEVGPGSWSSPAVVDGHLLVAGNTGLLRSFDVSGDPAGPRLEWTFQVGSGHIEATPAVWKNRIYIGSRDGFMYAVGQQDG